GTRVRLLHTSDAFRAEQQSRGCVFEVCARRFVPDSPLEGAVTSEPVSEAPKFPASRENTGNFINFGPGRPNLPSKQQSQSMAYEQIPYATEQGIKWSVSRN